MNGYNPKFDLDLKFGECAENQFKQILNNRKVEVKFDRKAYRTGNLCVEISYKDKPSGIINSDADYYYFIFDILDFGLLIRKDRLLDLCKQHQDSLVFGGDDGQSTFILIPLKNLFERVYN